METNRIGMENSNKGFIQIPHRIFNSFFLLDFNKRQLKFLQLIARLTYGCQNKKWASLKKSDLITINVLPPHAGKIIKELVAKGYVLQNGKTKEYRLNEEFLASEVTKNATFYLDKLNGLIGKQLAHKAYQNGNAEITKNVTEDLPNREPQGYQNGNANTLPNKEVSASNNTGPIPLKDILNKVKNSDKYTIASNNSFKEGVNDNES